MPANPEEIEEALAEGIQLVVLAAPSRIISRNGRVQLECLRMKLGAIDASGRRRPEPIKGSEFTSEFDTIIAAIGQRPEVPAQFNLEMGQGNIIKADQYTLATSVNGVFAGGDAITGPASVIEAIAAGRQAAISIDRYLSGSGEIDEKLAPEEEPPQPLEEAEEKRRPPMPTLPIEQRIHNFNQVELGYRDEMAMEEADRCLRCDLEERE
jgi:NADPH-dependent glutamate synthase beta subunit-like oxidoreductase